MSSTLSRAICAGDKESSSINSYLTRSLISANEGRFALVFLSSMIQKARCVTRGQFNYNCHDSSECFGKPGFRPEHVMEGTRDYQNADYCGTIILSFSKLKLAGLSRSSLASDISCSAHAIKARLRVAMIR